MPYDDRSPFSNSKQHPSMKDCITRNMYISLGMFYIAIAVGKCSVHTLDTDTPKYVIEEKNGYMAQGRPGD